MKILHLDTNHPLLLNQLNDLGFINDEDYTSSKEEIKLKIKEYSSWFCWDIIYWIPDMRRG